MNHKRATLKEMCSGNTELLHIIRSRPTIVAEISNTLLPCSKSVHVVLHVASTTGINDPEYCAGAPAAADVALGYCGRVVMISGNEMPEGSKFPSIDAIVVWESGGVGSVEGDLNSVL